MLALAEGVAEAIRDEAGLDDDAGPLALAFALLGPSALLVRPRLSEGAVYRAEVDQIWVRRGLGPQAASYLVAHELAERHMVRTGMELSGDDRDAFADAVAARLVAPRRIVRQVLRACGDDHVLVARELRTSQTIALVRLAEETRRPLVAVLPGRLIVRGSDFAWGDPHSVHRLERGPLPEGVERRHITDARRRWGLLAGDE